ncbi:MAG: ATP-binding protein [Myxococcota bacterium]
MDDGTVRCEVADGRIAIQLDADLRSFEAARLRLRSFLEDGGASERAIHRSELVFEEVCVNVIRHAYPGRRAGSRPIHAEARIADDDIVLTIEDEGLAFDPTAAPPHVPATSLDDARVGGRGIALTRLWTRRMSYARAGDRNRMTLVVALR